MDKATFVRAELAAPASPALRQRFIDDLIAMGVSIPAAQTAYDKITMEIHYYRQIKAIVDSTPHPIVDDR